MDEKEPKSLTIGDILDQLVKPSVIGGQGAPLPKPDNLPSQSLPTTKTQSGQQEVKLPQLGKTLEESSAKSSENQPKSEFRLSIRTMADDLAKLKSGQKVSAPEFQKSILSTPVPKPTLPKPQPPPTPVAPRPVPKPILPPSPPPSFRPPLSSQPTALPPNIAALPPLRPAPPAPTRPAPTPTRPTPQPVRPAPLPPISAPPLPTKEAQHFHPEKVVGEEFVLPPFLGAPIPKKARKPVKERIEYKLIAKIIGSGMTTGILITLVLAGAAYGLLYFFYLKQPETPIATSTPIPSGISPTPIINELETIFRNIGIINFELPGQKEAAVTSLKSFIDNQVLIKKEFKKINITLPNNQGQKISSFTDLMDSLSLNYPNEIKDQTTNNLLILLYGQEELFNEESASIPTKLVFISEVKDVTKISEIMTNWEQTLPEDLRELFDIDPSKEASMTFLDNERRGVKIRYKNFPLPDKTIDYAVISSLTNHHYLIITNSRESMYSPSDKIQGL